jgi:hypothetical protein
MPHLSPFFHQSSFSFSRSLSPIFALFFCLFIRCLSFSLMSRDSLVGIVTKLWAGRSELRSRGGARHPITSGANPVSCTVCSLPGDKRPGRETDHPPPCRAEVKNEWSYTHVPPWVFKVCKGTTLPWPLTFSFPFCDFCTDMFNMNIHGHATSAMFVCEFCTICETIIQELKHNMYFYDIQYSAWRLEWTFIKQSQL